MCLCGGLNSNSALVLLDACFYDAKGQRRVNITNEMDTIVQVEDVKHLIPANDMLWDIRVGHGAWHAQIPPCKECSRSLGRWGYMGALRVVLSDAWRRRWVLHGFNNNELP